MSEETDQREQQEREQSEFEAWCKRDCSPGAHTSEWYRRIWRESWQACADQYATWQPTPEGKRALPEPVRKYIMALETRCDPAGLVRENVLVREQARAMNERIAELERLLAETAPFDRIAADRMAAIVDDMVRGHMIDPRSPLADARLDYGEPFPADKTALYADAQGRIAALTAERDELANSLKQDDDTFICKCGLPIKSKWAAKLIAERDAARAELAQLRERLDRVLDRFAEKHPEWKAIIDAARKGEA